MSDAQKTNIQFHMCGSHMCSVLFNDRLDFLKLKFTSIQEISLKGPTVNKCLLILDLRPFRL